MFYVLEPQRDRGGKPDETCFLPCEDNEAETYAVFRRESYDDEPEYLGDVTPKAARALIDKAK